MRAYGNNREDNPQDQKRRYINHAPRAGDLREERSAKRRTRADGVREIRGAVSDMLVEDVPGGDEMRCGPDCPVCFYEHGGFERAMAEAIELDDEEESQTPAPSSSTLPR